MVFAEETLYGLDVFGKEHEDYALEYVYTCKEWWNPDGTISDIGKWFLVVSGRKLYLTGEGVDHVMFAVGATMDSLVRVE